MRWLVLLAGCGAEPVDTGSPPLPPWETDDDGDGYTADSDCDDHDPGLHPGATEICDGLDQDCDDAVDDNAADAPVWYPDDDGDGFGDQGGGVDACDPLGGWLETGTDCDDADAAVHPGADEHCDDTDDDCDGEVDEGDLPDPRTWYADADGDGFGDASVATVICAAPAGNVADGTDCDDSDASIFPGADEICDTTDDDCDGEVDEDPVDGRTWYTDADRDTYGDGATGAAACERPAWSTPDATDCDDATATTNPGAPETCDGVDDDCDGDIDEDAVDAPTWYVDTDRDGYGDAPYAGVTCSAPSIVYATLAGDCDDGNSDVHPDAVETCDGADEDCDGTEDDGAVDAGAWYADVDRDGFGDPTNIAYACDVPLGFTADDTDCDDTDADIHPGATWYADGDGDGFGDVSTTTTACDAPAGHTGDATDCDDTDPDTWPGAPEHCDDADDDCDGVIDEDAIDPATWHADTDGDAFGDPLVTTEGCDAPAGFVADAADCDDAEPYVYPGHPETCGDGMDNDCDGTDGGCTRVGTVAVDTAYQARFYGEAAGDLLGYRVDGAGDADGDGIGDVLVSGGGEGVVHLFYGVSYGDAGCLSADAAFLAGTVARPSSTANAGDFDGDGLTDLVAGVGPYTVDATNQGAAWVVGWSGSGPGDALVTLTGDAAYAGLGAAVAAGDLDGDGLSDVVVGAPQADPSGLSDAGSVCVVNGGAVGTVSCSSADTYIPGTAAYQRLGAAIAVVGDVDGDGLEDLLLGAPGDGTGGVLAGAALLFSGPVASGTATAVFTGDTTDQAGSAVAGAGDTDGDGTPELLVGATYADGAAVNSGAAYLLRGPFAGTTPLSGATAVVYGAAASDQAGSALDGAGDLDGDGFDDWIVGAWAWDDAGYSTGAAYVLFGPGPWSTDAGSADLRLTGGAAGDELGYAVAGAGDVTGDGLDDLLVGAPYADVGNTSAGSAYVVAGSGI